VHEDASLCTWEINWAVRKCAGLMKLWSCCRKPCNRALSLSHGTERNSSLCRSQVNLITCCSKGIKCFSKEQSGQNWNNKGVILCFFTFSTFFSVWSCCLSMKKVCKVTKHKVHSKGSYSILHISRSVSELPEMPQLSLESSSGNVHHSIPHLNNSCPIHTH